MIFAQQESVKYLMEKNIGVQFLYKDVPPKYCIDSSQTHFGAFNSVVEIDKSHSNVERVSQTPGVGRNSYHHLIDITLLIIPSDLQPMYNFKAYPNLYLNKVRAFRKECLNFVVPIRVIGYQKNSQGSNWFVFGFKFGLVQQRFDTPGITTE